MKKIITPILSLIMLSACNYETINTNIYGVTDEDIKKDGLLYGAPFMNMQQFVIPIGSPSLATTPGNDLQNTDLISSGNYIGYFGNNNTWDFENEATWNFTERRMSYAYQNLYSKMFRSWNDIYKATSVTNEPYDHQVLAVANIVKVLGWLRATDVFGPIVYTQAGDGDIAPKLDAQDVVYRNMLSELSKSVEILLKAPPTILTKYDLIYNGNIKNWVKLANSLMLRIAVRTHFKDVDLAREYISKALDPQNGGVIETKEDEAKIQSSGKMPLNNSMIPSVEEYSETRMGATIWAYLIGYADSRIDVYFTQGVNRGVNGDYPVAPTSVGGKRVGVNSPEFASKPKVEPNSPLYWMRASEVFFLKAEAALYGLISADARFLYEEGVKMSFIENGINLPNNYLKQVNKPLNMESGMYKFGFYTCNIKEGNVSPSWDDCNTSGDLVEQYLQKIITQKYLALYPNAVEAWTEYRRTGYPYIMKPQDANAYQRINAASDCLAPERFRFAPSEYSGNPNMAEVPALLGGSDDGSTSLWWVRNNRPKQPK